MNDLEIDERFLRLNPSNPNLYKNTCIKMGDGYFAHHWIYGEVFDKYGIQIIVEELSRLNAISSKIKYLSAVEIDIRKELEYCKSLEYEHEYNAMLATVLREVAEIKMKYILLNIDEELSQSNIKQVEPSVSNIVTGEIENHEIDKILNENAKVIALVETYKLTKNSNLKITNINGFNDLAKKYNVKAKSIYDCYCAAQTGNFDGEKHPERNIKNIENAIKVLELQKSDVLQYAQNQLIKAKNRQNKNS